MTKKMVNRISSALLKYAVGKALERNSPNSVPLSGWDRLQERNYFTVHLGVPDDEHVFLAESISRHGLNGYWWSDVPRRGIPASIPNTFLPSMSLRVRHYCREIEVEYRGPVRFLLGKLSAYSWLVLSAMRVRRWLFNRKTLVRDEQYELLKKIYGNTLRIGAYSTNAMDYMTEQYGAGWVGHPSNQEVRRYYQLLLDALESGGDLDKNGSSYSLNPQAIATLAAQEEDNRRHKDHVRQQSILIFLTFALVVVGLLQAAVGLWGD